MRHDQEDKKLQKEIEGARLELVHDFYRSREEIKQAAADIRKEILSRAILPRRKPINLAEVILSRPPAFTLMARTLFGLPAHPAAPVEQDPTPSKPQPINPKPTPPPTKKKRRGGRRKWGTPELRREKIQAYLDYLRMPGAAKKRAIDVVDFDSRVIEGWPEWKEVVGE